MPLKLVRRIVLILALVASFAGVPVLAMSAGSQEVAQSYGVGTVVRQGMIVGLKRGSTNQVVPLTHDTVSAMLGVIVGANDAALTLSGDTGAAQVYVINSGRYNVLVSTQNGVVHAGDYVSISSLNGIGMKADSTEALVLGKATADFTGTGSGVSSATLHGLLGSSSTVAVGSIPVDINITNNPTVGHGTGELPGFLQITSSSIADKPVSAQRVYLSLAVLLLSAFVSGMLLYSGVRTSMVSIGRNPLARRPIIRSLTQTVVTSIIIFVLGLFAVYLLLRL